METVRYNPSQSVAIRRNQTPPPRGLSTWMVQSSVEETAAKDRGWRRKKSSSPKMPPLTCMHPSNPRHCWCTQVQSVAISAISCNQSVAISAINLVHAGAICCNQPPEDRIAHIAHEAGAQDAIAQIHLLRRPHAAHAACAAHCDRSAHRRIQRLPQGYFAARDEVDGIGRSAFSEDDVAGRVPPLAEEGGKALEHIRPDEGGHQARNQMPSDPIRSNQRSRHHSASTSGDSTRESGDRRPSDRP